MGTIIIYYKSFKGENFCSLARAFLSILCREYFSISGNIPLICHEEEKF